MPNQITAPLWGDEGFSAILSMYSLPQIIKIIINDTSPPLWNISEWVIFNVFGKSEVNIRLLAMFYFMIAALFTFLAGRLLWNTKTGLIAGLATLLNPFFFTYAFEGRMYSIMSAGVAGSMYFFLTFIFGREKLRRTKVFNFIGYVITTLWALYSHHFAIFILITQGVWFLYLLVAQREKSAKVFFAFVCVVAGYIPWIMPLYHQTKMVGGGFWLGKPTFPQMFGLIFEYLAFGIKHRLAFPSLVLIVTAIISRSWQKDAKKSLFVISWFLLPILLAFSISQVFQSIFFNRYLLYTIPGAMLLVSSNLKIVGKLSLGTAFVLFLVMDVYYFTHPTKLPFPELARYAKSTTKQNDIVINWNGSSHHLWETKFYGLKAPIYVQGGDLPFFVGTALMTKNDLLRKIPDDAERVGIVTSGPVEEVAIPGFSQESLKVFDRLKFIWLVKN